MKRFRDGVPRWPPAAGVFLAGVFMVVVSLGMLGGRVAVHAMRSGRLLMAAGGLTLAVGSAFVFVRLGWIVSQVCEDILADWERDD